MMKRFETILGYMVLTRRMTNHFFTHFASLAPVPLAHIEPFETLAWKKGEGELVLGAIFPLIGEYFFLGET